MYQLGSHMMVIEYSHVLEPIRLSPQSETQYDASRVTL